MFAYFQKITALYFSSWKPLCSTLLCDATNVILPAARSLLALLRLQLCRFFLQVQRLTTVSPHIHIKQHVIAIHVKAFSLVCFCCLFRSCRAL